MKTLNKTALIILLFTIVMSACQSPTSTESKTVNEPSVFFKNIQNGAILSSPFLVEMGVEGMEVEAAGEINPLKGHHHIIINSDFISDGDIVPANAQHIHFGLGQIETTLDLDAGNYSLTLQFADGMHQSYGEGMSKTINVTVR
jgi:hypothetical protein